MKVLNCREVGRSFPGAVYIGRPSKWGNPFVIGKDGSREEVVDKFRIHLLVNEGLWRDLAELKDKDLICWCAPEACHDDVLVEMVMKYVA